MELFHSLGVHAAGDTRWDSHICLQGHSISCEHDVIYQKDDFLPHVWEEQIHSIRREVLRYFSESPFRGHCGNFSDSACDCGCHVQEVPLVDVVVCPIESMSSLSIYVKSISNNCNFISPFFSPCLLICWQHTNETWGFKQPETMYMVPFLREVYPSTVFVLAVRDGRDIG